MKNSLKKIFQKYLRRMILSGMIFFFVFSATPIFAAGEDSIFSEIGTDFGAMKTADLSAVVAQAEIAASVGGISTSDKASLLVAKSHLRYRNMKDQAIALKDKAWEALKRAAATSIHTGLKTLASRYAHDIAVKIASDGEGQQSLVEPRTVDQLLKDTANSTLGLFIENLGKGVWGEQFSLCEFDANIRLKIGLGLYRDFYTPPQPECGWDEMLENFNELNDQDINEYFQASIDPFSSEAGAVLVIGTNLLEESERKQQGEYGGYIAKQGWLDFRGPDDQVKTPAKTYEQAQWKSLDAVADWGREMTGDILTDALNVFTNTLLGTWIETMLTKGQIDIPREEKRIPSPDEPTGGVLASQDAEALGGGIQGAESYYNDLLEVEYAEGGTFDALLALASSCNDSEIWKCPVGSNAITEKFRSAIEQELSIQEALDKGLIDPNLPFGFGENGASLTRENGFPYRSILLLRKYRMISVGWEIAANYIRLYNGGKTVSLGEVVKDFSNIDSPFYGLIDPNWVLKAPKNYCVKQGPGPTITAVNEVAAVDVDSDGTNDTLASFAVMRDTEYCADERGCIKEDGNGGCLQYGFCLEERPVWDFVGADQCEPQYNTCETFTARNGQVTSLLQNTLDYQNCYEGNVGCGWYCSSYSFVDGIWRCTDQTHTHNVCDQAEGCYVTKDSSNCTIPYQGVSCIASTGETLYFGEPEFTTNTAVYLDGDAQNCTETEAGCSQFIPIGEAGINLLPNSSFEYVYDSEGNPITASSLDPIPSLAQFVGVTVVFGDAPSLSTSPRTGGVSLLLTSNSRIQIPVNLESSIANRTFSFALHAKDYITETEPNRSCAGITLRINNASSNTLDSIKEDWTRYGVVHSFGSYTIGTGLILEIDASSLDPANIGCLIDDLSLEEAEEPSSYGPYGSFFSYLKVAPDNYECEGYTEVDETLSDKESCENAGKVWRDDLGACVTSGSSACTSFALQCQSTDVGCELYTSMEDEFQVPAVVGASDYCPQECSGYDTFKQEATYLEDAVFPVYFIPSRATSCRAEEVGCDEFTNLDEAAKGGEDREYYSYVRQCKADSQGCGAFYTWIGSEDTGYQIRDYSLLTESDGSIAEVPTYLAIQGECDSIDDAVSDPECKQFFDAQGNEHFAFLKNTLSCTDSCSPYRKTSIGTLPIPEGTSDVATYCETGGGDWSTDTNTCYLCSKYSGNMYADGKDSTKDTANDGVVGNEACIFFIVPDEGIQCSAAASGCREYTGDTGESTLTVYENNFESGLTDWTNGTLSGESPYVGGHSLKISGNTAETSEGAMENIFTEAGMYLISFWAKHGSSNENVNLEFGVNSKGVESVAISEEWNAYTVGPIELDSAQIESVFTSLSTLFLRGVKEDGNLTTANLYVDNFSIEQLSDTLYVKKNSWSTPASCDQDPFGVSSPQYMLGCEEYTGRDGGKLYLKSFESLCRDELVGCKAFIDTENSSSPFETQYGPESSRIMIPADEPIFLVDNGEYSCGTNSKGCQALGKPTYNEKYELASLETTYLVNDPDQYSTILCSQEELWCEAWSAGDEVTYFKNPLTEVCEYKEVESASGPGWYKVGTESGPPDCPVFFTEIGNTIPAFAMCRGGQKEGQGCIVDADCGADGKCEENHWVGLCPSTQASCTEYIDAGSTIERNILTNGNFEQHEEEDSAPDKWEGEFGSKGYSKEGVANSYAVFTKSSESAFLNIATEESLKPQTLYTISGSIRKDKDVAYSSDKDYAYISVRATEDTSHLSSFDNSMIFLGEDDVLELRVSLQRLTNGYLRFSGRFYSGQNFGKAQIGIGANTSISEGVWFDDISLVETGIYYNLKDSVDYTSCQGIDEENNCVLFHDRSDVDWTSYGQSLENYFSDPLKNSFDTSSLVYDADQNSTDCSNPNQSSTICESNRIIKTRKNRICEDWLYCKSATTAYNANTQKEEDICLDLGRCNEMDVSGRCISAPVENDPVNLTFNKGNVEQLAYLTGYSKAGFDWGNGQVVEGYFPSSQMDQFGSLTLVPNGGFEYALANGKPFAWDTDPLDPTLFEQGAFRVLTSLSDIQNALQTNSIVLPPQGKSFLGVRAGEDIVIASQPMSVLPNTEYVLSAVIDTSKMYAGSIMIQVAEFDVSGAEYLDREKNIFVEQVAGIPWARVSHLWKTGSKTSQIRIYFATKTSTGVGEVSLSGTAFFDDIELTPSLLLREKEKTYESSYQNTLYADRECRLYPDEEAATCEYLSGDGTQRRGWYGYCLEYDPENPNVCFSWWPVDQVSGDSSDANTALAYRSRVPLYMCMEMQAYANSYSSPTVLEFGAAQECVASGQYVWSDGFAKGLYKNEIGSITVIGQESAPFSALILNEENGWTKTAQNSIAGNDSFSTNCPSGTMNYDEIAICGCNENVNNGTYVNDNDEEVTDYDDNYGIGLRAVFTGGVNPRFSHIEVVAQGHYNAIKDIPFRAVIEFELWDRICTTVAQVVTPYGENQAWAERLDPLSKYSVNNLGFTYSMDYRPFGGIVPPDPVEDPAQWDFVPGTSVCSNDTTISCRSNDECGYNGICTDLYRGRQPLRWQLPDTALFSTAPYQVRFSSPYAYVGGDAKVPFLTCSQTKQMCIYDTDCPNYSTGEKCTNTAPFNLTVSKQDTYQEAVDIVKQIFAKSYGVWEYEQGICGDINGKAGQMCYTNFDCNVDGSIPETGLIVENIKYPMEGLSQEEGQAGDPRNGDINVREEAQLKMQEVGHQSFGVVAMCQYVETDFQVGGKSVIPEKDITKIVIPNIHDDDDLILTQVNGVWAGYYPNEELCDGTFVDACTCFTNSKPNVDSGRVYYAVANFDTRNGERYLKNVKLSIDDFNGVSSSLEDTDTFSAQIYLQEEAGECEGAAGYTPSAQKTGWNTPTALCEDTDTRQVDEYCAMAPEVFNEKLSSDIHYQGYTSLSFNSSIDKEQLPLSGVRIDWGDGEVTSLSGLNSPHRPNENDPHKFTHFYSYWDMYQKGRTSERIDCPEVNGNQYCFTKVRIQIFDHWGWCNGGFYGPDCGKEDPLDDGKSIPWEEVAVYIWKE